MLNFIYLKATVNNNWLDNIYSSIYISEMFFIHKVPIKSLPETPKFEANVKLVHAQPLPQAKDI